MSRIRLICVDMDGTLLSPDHVTISKANITAIAKANAAGVAVVPATGRIVSRLRAQLTQLPATRWAIVSNGGEVLDLVSGAVLGGRYLSPELTLELVAKFDAEHLCPMVYQGEQMLIRPADLAVLSADKAEAGHLAQMPALQTVVPDFAARFAADPSRIQKINVPLVAPPERRRRLLSELAALGICEVTTSMPTNIECNALGATKATGIALLCRHLGITPDEVLVIGDSENDLPMFAAAGHAAAMGNACDAVKACATFITDTNEHDGVAKAILRALAL